MRMLIRMRVNVVGHERVLREGEIVDCTDPRAPDWIAAGLAESIAAPAPPPIAEPARTLPDVAIERANPAASLPEALPDLPEPDDEPAIEAEAETGIELEPEPAIAPESHSPRRRGRR